MFKNLLKTVMKIIYCHNGFDKVYQTIIKMKHNTEMVGKICIDMKLAIDSFLLFTPKTFLFEKLFFLHFCTFFYTFTLFCPVALTHF